MARGRSGGTRRPCHPRPSSSTSLLPSVACVCCPPAASSARLLLPPAVLTRPPVVLFSLLSLQVLHATVAAAVRSRPAFSSISRPRAFERCKQRFQTENFGACGGPRAIVEAAGWHCWRHRVWLSYRVGGTFHRGPVRWSGRKLSNFFLLQKWIDLDELNPMVWVPSIVRRRIDFFLAVFELGAPRELHPYMPAQSAPHHHGRDVHFLYISRCNGLLRSIIIHRHYGRDGFAEQTRGQLR